MHRAQEFLHREQEFFEHWKDAVQIAGYGLFETEREMGIRKLKPKMT